MELHQWGIPTQVLLASVRCCKCKQTYWEFRIVWFQGQRETDAVDVIRYVKMKGKQGHDDDNN